MKKSKISVYLGLYPIFLTWIYNSKHKNFYTVGLITSILNHITRDNQNKNLVLLHNIFVSFDRLFLSYICFFLREKNYIILKFICGIIYLMSKNKYLYKHTEFLHVICHCLICAFIIMQI